MVMMMMLRRSSAAISRCGSSSNGADGLLRQVAKGLSPAASSGTNDAWTAIHADRMIASVASDCSSVKGFIKVLGGLSRQSWLTSSTNSGMKDISRSQGFHRSYVNNAFGRYSIVPSLARTLSSSTSSQSSQRAAAEDSRKDLATSEDPFDSPTYNIPEKPVTFTEGASYSIVILLGLAAAAAAAYAVFKELIFEPKEYKIYGKALERVQSDSQVRVRIGSPVTGYGQESRNRAARQRIAHKVWTDEDGVEHIEVNFYIRGPHGAGRVYSEMFRDKVDREWKFTYLIVDVTAPSQSRLMLESYVPA
ncbi:import inner membrane translocase subunit [Wolffia australiana]